MSIALSIRVLPEPITSPNGRFETRKLSNRLAVFPMVNQSICKLIGLLEEVPNAKGDYIFHSPNSVGFFPPRRFKNSTIKQVGIYYQNTTDDEDSVEHLDLMKLKSYIKTMMREADGKMGATADDDYFTEKMGWNSENYNLGKYHALEELLWKMEEIENEHV